MRLDLDARLTAAFIFGILGLAGELAGSLLGAAVNDALVGGLVTLVLGTIGVGAIRGGAQGPPKDAGQAQEEKNPK